MYKRASKQVLVRICIRRPSPRAPFSLDYHSTMWSIRGGVNERFPVCADGPVVRRSASQGAGGAVRYGAFRPAWFSRLLRLCRVGSLSDVVLSYTCVPEELWRLVARLPFIRVIDARGSSITDHAMCHVGRVRGLVLLDAGDTGVTDEGVACLEHHRSLEILMLDGTGITNRSLTVLSELPRLEVLFLEKTAIDDEGLEHLATSLTLRWLRLRGSRVSAAAVDELRARLPSCKIYWSPESANT